MTVNLTDIANLTPEESFKAGLPIVLQLEAWIAKCEELKEMAYASRFDSTFAYAVGASEAYRDALALVTAKDADRDLEQ